MKKIGLLLGLICFCLPGFLPARPVKGVGSAKSCEEQLSAYLTHPEVLTKKNLGGIVVIQFQVNPDNRLARLEVFSPDEQLNASLIRQLTGKKLNLPEYDFKKTYTVRLHFQTPKP